VRTGRVWYPSTPVGVGSIRSSHSAVGIRASVLASHHYPLVTLLAQVIVHQHTRRRVAAFRRNRYRRIGFVTLVMDGRHFYVHATKIQATLSLRQMIQHPLTHGVGALDAAITPRERNEQQQYQVESHFFDYNREG
jgi:hypothetical protein